MSIAYEINRLQTSKADTKEQVNIDKDYINAGIDFIGSETVDDYDEKIQEMQEAYKAFIPVSTTSDTQIDAPKGGTIMGKTLKGNTTQNGTPTPSTPVPVNNVTGEQVARVCGKNLLPNNATTTTVNGITFTINEDKSILVNGTATSNIMFYLLLPSENKIIDTGNYYLSGCPSGGTPETYRLVIGVNETLYGEYGSGRALTLNKGILKSYIYITSGTTINNKIYKPQLEKGNTPTTYEPYQGKDYEINLGNIELNKIGDYQDFIRKGSGKNLFDKNNANILNGWLDNNKMALNPTQLNRLFYIPCKANTIYTISRSILTSTFRVATYDSEPFPTIGSSEVQYNISGLIKDNSATSITITTGANAKYLIVHYGRLETDPNIEESLKTIQIEENSSVTYYEPFGYKDKWYIEKNVGKVVLNGSRDWTKSGNTNIDRFVLSGYVDYGDTNCFSNYFDNGIYSDTNYTKNQIFLNTYSSTKRIIINYSTVGTTTLAQFKTWLQTNNTKVYYVLANPTYTLIDNEELLNQLERIMQLYEGQNNILVTGDLAATLDLDYIVKAENHL